MRSSGSTRIDSTTLSTGFTVIPGGAVSVTASTTPKGRWLFGAGIGFFIFVIRTWGSYPDGIAFAVLLMNMSVPLLDYYTMPRAYGHKWSELPGEDKHQDPKQP